MSKINFNELEKLSYEVGKEMLLKAGYTQGTTETDDENYQLNGYAINDEYFVLTGDNGNELHMVSYVSYTKDVLGDEPELVNKENWHWSEVQ